MERLNCRGFGVTYHNRKKFGTEFSGTEADVKKIKEFFLTHKGLYYPSEIKRMANIKITFTHVLVAATLRYCQIYETDSGLLGWNKEIGKSNIDRTE